MSSRGPATVALTLLGVALLAGLLMRSRDEGAVGIDSTVKGDVTEVVGALDAPAMPGHAQTLLETQRPWRAAQVMRRYLELTPAAPAEHRLLAAQAEAGWGGW